MTSQTIAVSSMLATLFAGLVALIMPWWLRWFESRQLRRALKYEYENARVRLKNGFNLDSMPEGINEVSWLNAHLRTLTTPIWQHNQGQAALLLDNDTYQEMKDFYLDISLNAPIISRWESARASEKNTAQTETEMNIAFQLLRRQAQQEPVKLADSHPDRHRLDPYIRLIATRWFLWLFLAFSMVAGISLSTYTNDGQWLQRFGNLISVAGLLGTSARTFHLGIWVSQGGSMRLGTQHRDGTVIQTIPAEREIGDTVLLGIAMAIFGALISGFGDIFWGVSLY